MYSIKQLQGMDFLLKRIVRNSSNKLYQKDVKIVVRIDDEYWYGDFVNHDSSYITQYYVDGFGQYDYEYFDQDNEHKVLSPVWDKFKETASVTNKTFKNTDDLKLIFLELSKIIQSVSFDNQETPFHPYLLNAKLLKDKKVSLPFVIVNNDVPVVSLLEVSEK